MSKCLALATHPEVAQDLQLFSLPDKSSYKTAVVLNFMLIKYTIDKMRRSPIRKFFGLTVLYSSFIIGIFALQFKSETVISKKMGNLSYSLSNTQTEDNITKLKNQFHISFKSLSFLCDESNPVTVKDKDNNIIPVILEDYEELDEHGIKLVFSDESTVSFNNINDELGITTTLGQDSASVTIPLKIAPNYTTEFLDESKAVISSKSDDYLFTAAGISPDSITLTKADGLARYSIYEKVVKFTFDAVAGLVGTTPENFNQNTTRLREKLIAEVTQIIQSGKGDILTEEDVAAFVAEQALGGRFNQALDMIPDSFKKSNKRTYFTAPYFGSLASMSITLNNQSGKYSQMIDSNSIDVFTVKGISDYILRMKKTQKIQQFLYSFSANAGFDPDPYQAAGIISVYTDLYDKAQDLAAYLEPAVELCIQKIQDCSTLENNKLYIKKNETTVFDSYQAVFTGNALLKLGTLRGNSILKEAGYLIINSITDSETMDLKTISSIYPMIVSNFYYPHSIVVGYRGNEAIWAWTCARSIEYVTDTEKDTGEIVIDFPQNLTHYLFLKNIPDFGGRIEIQGIRFRTDPRFETYNSSGYVYQAPSKTLLLKSRHKTRTELIKLFFSAPAPKKSEPVKETKKESPSPSDAPANSAATVETEPQVELPKIEIQSVSD